jgi:hypothetical protein
VSGRDTDLHIHPERRSPEAVELPFALDTMRLAEERNELWMSVAEDIEDRALALRGRKLALHGEFDLDRILGHLISLVGVTTAG